MPLWSLIYAPGWRTPRRFKKEPHPLFGLIDPVFQQARGRDVAMLVAEIVNLAHGADQLQIIVSQFGQHVVGRDVLRIIVQDSRLAADLADRSEGHATDLAHALGNRVGRFEYFRTLFVKHKVIVTEVRAGHMPVEVFRLHIKGEKIGEQRRQCAGKIFDGVVGKVCRRFERRFATRLDGIGFHERRSLLNLLPGKCRRECRRW